MSRDRVLQLGEFRLDVAGRSVSRRGEVVALPPKAVEALIRLVETPGRTVVKEELLESVWAGTFVEEGSLTQAISILRKAFGERSEGSSGSERFRSADIVYVGPVARSRILLLEELIAQLSTLDAMPLAVIARTSAITYKGTHKSIDQIARELDVDCVLESSLRWSTRSCEAQCSRPRPEQLPNPQRPDSS